MDIFVRLRAFGKDVLDTGHGATHLAETLFIGHVGAGALVCLSGGGRRGPKEDGLVRKGEGSCVTDDGDGDGGG